MALFLFMFLILPCQAQLVGPSDFSRKFTGGVTTNTRSGILGGAFFRYSLLIDDYRCRTLGIEICECKAPQRD